MLQVVPRRKFDKTLLKDMQNPILLGLGANLNSFAGPPADTINEALEELGRSELLVRATSRLFQTPAFPPSSGFDYVNAAVLCQIDLEPSAILALLHRIEEKFGRIRKHRWGARTLDIDLLAVGNQVFPNHETHGIWRGLTLQEQQKTVPRELILPHPRMQERSFVLAPLADVAADWEHPILGKTVAEMLDDLPAKALDGVVPI